MSTIIRSSTTFKEKIELPSPSKFINNGCCSVAFDKLEVRRHSGFWGSRRDKWCVLMHDGRLLIYSSCGNRGISISVPELSELRITISSKEVVGLESSMRCEVEMLRGKEKIMLKIRGTEKATRWREAITKAAHHGLTANGEMEGSPTRGASWTWRQPKDFPTTVRSAGSSERTTTPGTLTNSPKEAVKGFDVSPNPAPSFQLGAASSGTLSRQSSIADEEYIESPPPVRSPMVSSRKMSKAVSFSILTENESTIYQSALSYREKGLPRLRSDSLVLRSLFEDSHLGEASFCCT